MFENCENDVPTPLTPVPLDNITTDSHQLAATSTTELFEQFKQRRGKPRERTLLIENMINFKSYDNIENIMSKYGRVELIKQKPQSQGWVKCYVVFSDSLEVENIMNSEHRLEEKFGDQILLSAVRIADSDLRLGTKGPYVVNRKKKEEEKLKKQRDETKRRLIPKYYWATFKKDRKNFIKAKNWLYNKIGETSW